MVSPQAREIVIGSCLTTLILHPRPSTAGPNLYRAKVSADSVRYRDRIWMAEANMDSDGTTDRFQIVKPA